MESLKYQVKLVCEIALVLVCLVVELLKQLYYLVAQRHIKDVRGQTALITGTSQGMGREMALSLARKGCDVICVDILTKGNEETAEEIRKLGQKSEAYTCDVADRKQVANLANKVGNIDILINNAGIIYFEPLVSTPPDVVIKVVDVNVTSHFWMIQAFLPRMLERKRGHIVGMASLAGLEGLPGGMVYSATKHAVVGLMRTLELELRQNCQQYVKTTIISPYFVDTVDDVKLRVQCRAPRLDTKTAVRKIIKAILQELPEVTIPAEFSLLTAINSLFPRKIQHMMRDVYYTRILPREVVSNSVMEKKSH